MAALPRAIRTPDQRIRVFVSSTLKELEPERRAARAAIEALRLAPVMFELGARPHPPRDLYRSYLAQSDVFVGIYGERYGWVAPGEAVSGLEDEYLLSAGLPRLIYLKEPAPARDDRLADLLDRIRDDDGASYKTFADSAELARLIEGDLATLLAERFDAARSAAPQDADAPLQEIPAPYTALVGRTAELHGVRELLARPDVRLVTLLGPGGIGKSRLAIEIASEVAASGRSVAFALLEAVTSPESVIVVLARALGVRDAATEGHLQDRVIAAVGDQDLLLVVDNMEHVLDATPAVVRLITETPRLQVLVTSRSPLRVRPEHVFEIGPLPVPPEGADAAAAPASDAVRLFVDRAVAVRPDFRLTSRNATAIGRICRALDGVPLAIELAAARIRSLSAEQVLERLDSALTLLVGGARDLPERQQALRSTIRWSADLLDEQARSALCTLSVFTGTFSLASAETVLAAVGIDDPFSAIEALVDASLVAASEQRGMAAFRMLSLVRAYGLESAAPAEHERATAAWLAAYRDLVDDAARVLRGADQLDMLARLEVEIENLASVERTLLTRRAFDDAAEYAWSLYVFLWIGGYLGVVREWMLELLAIVEREQLPLSPRTHAIAQYYNGAILFWQDPGADVVPILTESRDAFHATGDEDGAALAGASLALALLTRTPPDIAAAKEVLAASRAGFRTADDTWGQAMALVLLGRVELLAGAGDSALSRFEESLALATDQGERLGIVIAQNHRGWARFLSGDIAHAVDDFATGLDLSLALGHDEGIAYGLESFVGVRALEGDARGAGLLYGAARTLRIRKGILNPGAFELYMIPLQKLRESGLGDEFDRAAAEGRALTVAEALEHVRA
ncbi:DUF4062 domain-containing protein [Microbacterium ulmi]|uniref:DUF4062 domain-containing protein n=1 Tax=Microbacterium ulmi TaxID=179095 RepID=A0A7Y2Q1F8_9MICO|nr:DUF4062 domain-containing protein [Microbacterium ulmi]NII70173.1 putative ATPase [Microbacterium ulmi]NNH04287.1 DUF4062 domain-containing protein [Microbacterium ulmi]